MARIRRHERQMMRRWLREDKARKRAARRAAFSQSFPLKDMTGTRRGMAVALSVIILMLGGLGYLLYWSYTQIAVHFTGLLAP